MPSKTEEYINMYQECQEQHWRDFFKKQW